MNVEMDSSYIRNLPCESSSSSGNPVVNSSSHVIQPVIINVEPRISNDWNNMEIISVSYIPNLYHSKIFKCLFIFNMLTIFAFSFTMIIYIMIYFDMVQKNSYFVNAFNDPQLTHPVCYLRIDNDVSKFYDGICPFSQETNGTITLYIHALDPDNGGGYNMLYVNSSTGVKIINVNACERRCYHTKYINIKDGAKNVKLAIRIFAETTKNYKFLFSDRLVEVIMWQNDPHATNFYLYLTFFIVSLIIFTTCCFISMRIWVEFCYGENESSENELKNLMYTLTCLSIFTALIFGGFLLSFNCLI